MCPATPPGRLVAVQSGPSAFCQLGPPRAVNTVGTPHPRAWEGRGRSWGVGGVLHGSGSQIPTAGVRSTPEPSPPGAVTILCPATTMGPAGGRGPGPQGQLPSQGGWEPARQSSRRNSNSPVGMASFTALEEALFESRQWGEGSGLGVRRPPPPHPHPTV